MRLNVARSSTRAFGPPPGACRATTTPRSMEEMRCTWTEPPKTLFDRVLDWGEPVALIAPAIVAVALVVAPAAPDTNPVVGSRAAASRSPPRSAHRQ